MALLAFHFALPFALLLSRPLKRNARALGAVAALMLVMQLIDLFWLIGPDLAAHGEGAVPLRVHWMDLAAAFGLGGIWTFLFARQAGGAPVLPVGEPEVRELLAAGAEAFVTADVRYHEFQRAAGRLTLADAGHFETEFPVVPALVRRLRGALHGTGLRVDRALTITGNCSVPQSFIQKFPCSAQDMTPPTGLPFYPGHQLVLERREAQKEVFRRLKTRRRRTKDTAKVFKLRWVQGFTALFTFITPCFGEATARTSTFQIAVGEESLTLSAIRLKHLIFVDVTLVEQIEEYVMSDLSVIRCTSGSKQVEGDAQFLPAVNKLLVIFVHHLLWRTGFSLGTNCNWGSVLIAAGNHEHFIANRKHPRLAIR